MKKILLIVISTLILFSCSTWHEDYARTHGWIDPESALELRKKIENLPERLELPRPIISSIELEVIQVIDKIISDPTYIPTEFEGVLMQAMLVQDGTIDKLSYLVEIYERHYLNKEGVIHPDRPLQEIIDEYYALLTPIEKAQVTSE